jgi:hypothetical protein
MKHEEASRRGSGGLVKMKAREEYENLQDEAAYLNRRMREK